MRTLLHEYIVVLTALPNYLIFRVASVVIPAAVGVHICLDNRHTLGGKNNVITEWLTNYYRGQCAHSGKVNRNTRWVIVIDVASK